MKLFHLILSFYLVALTCFPCSDIEDDCGDKDKQEIVAGNDQHSDENSNDACSPFCVCSCCGAQVLSYFPDTTFSFPVATTQIIKQQLPSYKTVYFSNFFGSIWQPPKIG